MTSMIHTHTPTDHFIWKKPNKQTKIHLQGQFTYTDKKTQKKRKQQQETSFIKNRSNIIIIIISQI